MGARPIPKPLHPHGIEAPLDPRGVLGANELNVEDSRESQNSTDRGRGKRAAALVRCTLLLLHSQPRKGRAPNPGMRLISLLVTSFFSTSHFRLLRC